MIPAAFEYTRAQSIGHALELLTQHGDEAKLLAGGHSLLPLMKLRLAVPGVLVDLGGLSDLNYIKEEGSTLKIGAMTRYVDIERSNTIREKAPVLGEVCRHVGDAQVRNRGTIGGALAHADPAGDLPCVARAMNMTVVTRSPRGDRRISSDDFFLDLFQPAMEADEMVVEVVVPLSTRPLQHYEKFRRRLCDWAIIGSCINVEVEDGRITGARVALTNAGPTPVRAAATERALMGQAFTAEVVSRAAALASDGLEPSPELNASSEYKKHLAGVITRRALERALTV